MDDKASLGEIADFNVDEKANSATSSDDISFQLVTYEKTIVIDSSVVRETVDYQAVNDAMDLNDD